MADLGHVLTDKELEALEKRIAEEYAKASRDMKRKYREYMAKFEEERQEKYQLWQEGKITKKEYTDFVYRKTMVGNRWKEMQQVLAEDLKHADEMALGIARDKMPDIFALNANFGTYDIEHGGKIDTGFTLYNHDTAAYLMEDRQLMPGPSTKKAKEIAADKSMQWNQRKIQSAVLQGVLQGESPYKVAERLTGVAQMGLNASIRYARTMTTSAQNAGRYESYHRAKNLGVDLTIEWQATLDGRTRHEHRMMHGQRRNVDEPFELDGVKILYPAQSSGAGSSDIPQSMIWNCRCTLLAWVKGFEGDTVKSSPKMGEMSFEEWQHEKEPKKEQSDKRQNTGTNIFGEQIQFSEKMGREKWDAAKELITDLANGYDTKLKTVSIGAHQGAGEVQISGTIMRISNPNPDVVIHEFAHTISMRDQTKFGLYNEENFWKEISAVRRRYKAAVGNDTNRWISAYEHGHKSVDEFMAEAFTLATLRDRGLEIPAKYGRDFTYADEVLRIVRKYFGR